MEAAPSEPAFLPAAAVPPSSPLLQTVTTSAPVDVAPVVLPSLPAPSIKSGVPDTGKWATQLHRMAEMGYHDIEANVLVLEKSGGHVSLPVSALSQKK